jgi:hypothetical protein
VLPVNAGAILEFGSPTGIGVHVVGLWDAVSIDTSS